MKRFWATCRLFDAQDLARPLQSSTRAALSDLHTQVLLQIQRLKDPPQGESVLTVGRRAHPGLPDQTVLDNFMFLFRIGVNNVSSLLRWIFKMLADQPEWGEKVRRREMCQISPRWPNGS